MKIKNLFNSKNTKAILLNILNDILYYVVIIFVWMLYTGISKKFISYGGLSSSLIKHTEIWFILIIATILRINTWKWYKNTIFPIITILSLYIGFDITFVYLNSVPTFDMIKDLQSFIFISPYLSILTIILEAGIFLPSTIVLINVIKKKNYYHILKTIIITILVYFYLSPNTKYQENKINMYALSPIRKSGRISMFLYKKIQQNKIFDNLKPIYKDNSIYYSLYRRVVSNVSSQFKQKKTNFVFVLLESFLNPYDLDIKIPKNIYAPNFKYKFTHIKSPTFGGITIKSEFEVTTGLPSLALFGQETNLIKIFNKPFPSYAKFLKKYNYKSLIVIGSKDIFGEDKYYNDIGYNFSVFAQNNNYNKKNTKFMYEGALYNFVLNNKSVNKQLKKPFLLNIMSVYGHIPYPRNKIERPDIISKKDMMIANPDITISDYLMAELNYFYYRTKELGSFVKKFTTKYGKNTIFVFFADHLPSKVITKNLKYKLNSIYWSSALIIKGTTEINIPDQKYHIRDLPFITWELANDLEIKTPYTNTQEAENIYKNSFYYLNNNK